MALIKRHARTQPAAKTATTPESAATPRRAIMRRTVREANNVEAEVLTAKAAILEDLKLIAKNNAAIDTAQASTEQAMARIKALMEQHKLPAQTDGKLIAELIEQFTKESRHIDPQRFYNAVPEEDFWPCISVSITEAKKVMAEKELNKIAKITPARSNGFVLKIKEYTTTTTRKAK